MTPRAKKCKVCTEPFVPRQPMQRVCGVDCAKAEAVRVRQHAEKKADRAKREKLKPRADWLKEAQTAFNSYIRLRDDRLPCVSCGRESISGWNAGHFMSVGSHPELRFEEDNVHKQCIHCNLHKHGNALMYRLALIEKIGLDRVEWLEGPHEPQKWTIDDLKAIKADYSAKTRALKR